MSISQVSRIGTAGIAVPSPPLPGTIGLSPSSCPRGAAVTITIINQSATGDFRTGDVANMNNKDYPVTIVNPNTCTFAVPSGDTQTPGTYPVFVKRAGTSNSGSRNFTIQAGTLLSLGTLSVNMGPVQRVPRSGEEYSVVEVRSVEELFEPTDQILVNATPVRGGYMSPGLILLYPPKDFDIPIRQIEAYRPSTGALSAPYVPEGGESVATKTGSKPGVVQKVGQSAPKAIEGEPLHPSKTPPKK